MVDQFPTDSEPKPSSENPAALINDEQPLVELVSGFEEYISKEHRTQLAPFLVDTYKGQAPKKFGYMLFALDTLGLIERTILTRHTELHAALTTTFGFVGSRQRIQQLMGELGGADSKEEHQIKTHKDRIKAFLWPA